MKKLVILCALLIMSELSVCADSSDALLYPINEIVVVIYSTDGNQLILRLDIRPSLDGMPRTLRQVVLESLMVLDALLLKIDITEDDADKFLAHLQKENGLTRQAIQDMFKELGFTYEEGREQLRRKQMIDAVLDYRVKMNIIVQRADVVAYYDAHPEYTEATYTLAQAYIPEDSLSREEVDNRIESGNLDRGITWDEPFTLAEHELADDKKFITNEPVGSVVEIEEVEDGVELTRLLSKTEQQLIPLDDRYEEISMILRKEQFETKLEDYFQSLLDKAVMRFSHPEDEKLVFSPER